MTAKRFCFEHVWWFGIPRRFPGVCQQEDGDWRLVLGYSQTRRDCTGLPFSLLGSRRW